MPTLSIKANRFYPSLPEITQDSVSHTNALMQIKSALQTHERRDGSYLKSFVRFEELIALGIVDENGDSTLSATLGGTLGGLSDVTLSGVADNNILGYNVGTSEWVNQTSSQLGIVEEAPTDGSNYVRNNAAWVIASGGGVTDHLLLANIGTNTHAAIDLHLGDVSIHTEDVLLVHKAGTEVITGVKQFENLTFFNADLTIANATAINWKDSSSNAVELLVFKDPNGGVLTLPDIDTVVFDSATNPGDTFAEQAGVTMSEDGAYLFVAQLRLSTLSRYPLSTAYDITTLGATDQVSGVFNASNNNLRDIRWSNNGLRFSWGLDTVQTLSTTTVTTPYAASEVGNNPIVTTNFPSLGALRGFEFSPDGMFLIIAMNIGIIKAYSLPTPYDIVGKVEMQAGSFIYDATIDWQGIIASSDGKKFWAMESANATIYQFSFGTAWDESTAVFDNIIYPLAFSPPPAINIAALRGVGILLVGYYGVGLVNDCVIQKYTFAFEGGNNFIVGDPVFPTKVEGLSTTITSPSTILDGTLRVAGVTTLNSDVSITGNLALTGIADGRDIALDGTTQDTHIADATIHFTEASINHANILGIGTNTHAQIDTHIADGTIHFPQVVVSTTVALEAIADAINTSADKVAGYMVFNTTTNAPVWAVGAADADVWNNASGVATHTPI